MESKRVEWVDVCRGLAILAIFIGHVGNSDIVTTFVFRYHVPLFFFLSGFFYDKRRALPIKEYFFKCVKGTLIPYTFFCVLGIVFYIVISGSPLGVSKIYLKQAFFGVRNQIDFGGQLWFFTCLFSIQILYYLLDRLVKNKILLAALTLSSALLSAIFLKIPGVPALFFNIDSALYYIFFYCIGDIIFPKMQSFSFSTLQKHIFSIFSFLVLGATFYIYTKYQEIDMIAVKISNLMSFYNLNTFIYQLLVILIIFILISANIIVSVALKKSRFLADIGQNTMILCGLESISFIIAYSLLAFFGISVKVDTVLYKVIIVAFKIGIIKFVFFNLFNKCLPWAIGRKRTIDI